MGAKEKARRAKAEYDKIRNDDSQWTLLQSRAKVADAEARRAQLQDPPTASRESLEHYIEVFEVNSKLAAREGLAGFSVLGLPMTEKGGTSQADVVWIGDLASGWASKTDALERIEQLANELVQFSLKANTVIKLSESSTCYDRELESKYLESACRQRLLCLMAEALPPSVKRPTRVEWKTLGKQLMRLRIFLIIPEELDVPYEERDWSPDDQKIFVESRRPIPGRRAFCHQFSEEDKLLLDADDDAAGDIVLIKGWAEDEERGEVKLRLKDTEWWETRMEKKNAANGQIKKGRGRPPKRPQIDEGEGDPTGESVNVAANGRPKKKAKVTAAKRTTTAKRTATAKHPATAKRTTTPSTSLSSSSATPALSPPSASSSMPSRSPPSAPSSMLPMPGQLPYPAWSPTSHMPAPLPTYDAPSMPHPFPALVPSLGSHMQAPLSVYDAPMMQNALPTSAGLPYLEQGTDVAQAWDALEAYLASQSLLDEDILQGSGVANAAHGDLSPSDGLMAQHGVMHQVVSNQGHFLAPQQGSWNMGGN